MCVVSVNVGGMCNYFFDIHYSVSDADLFFIVRVILANMNEDELV